MAASEPDIDLGTTATIDPNAGTVTVGGQALAVRSIAVAQSSGPTIAVFIVHGLTASTVTVAGGSTGTNAIAIVSNGDIQIGGVFAASAVNNLPGPGAFETGDCKGHDGITTGNAFGGGGGGGFGGGGGGGGGAHNDAAGSPGTAGGSPTGNAQLVPLRGGCRGGTGFGSVAGGGGGGAVQLVSRTKITITGVVAASGGSNAGGGSGGGILLEAPLVEVLGSVVANGGGGSCFGFNDSSVGEQGRLDATPAQGGSGCPSFSGAGGNGAAGTVPAAFGIAVTNVGTGATWGGTGGGGVGRIRINTIPGGFHRAGLFSPEPSTGDLGLR